MTNSNSINRIINQTMFCIVLMLASVQGYSEIIPVQVKQATKGAPITMGIPFAKGALASPDHVRVLDNQGNEIPSQTTLVTTWEPVDYSVKWLWVFFFSTGDENYTIEHGPNIRKAPITGPKIKVKNAQRAGQTSQVNTGVLRFNIGKRKGGGFIDDIIFDIDKNGYDENDTIATSKNGRGSFLDILDDLGIDKSQATIHRSVRERGSGPLHTILRLDGNYTYEREDNRDSPFVIRIHLYAGKSYIRVFHTLTYTGIPDKHKPVPGEHENIALDAVGEIKDDSETMDSGWMKPNDQIHSTGLSLVYKLNGDLKYRSGMNLGTYYNPGNSEIFKANLAANQSASVFQTGPKPNRVPPVPNSDMDERIDGFESHINIDGKQVNKMERADGWSSVTDNKWGIGIGIKNFLEEYPKEIYFDTKANNATAFFWSPKAGPMSFARSSLRRDQGMIANFAEGVTKTTEMVLYFHDAKATDKEVERTMKYFLDPPIPHASAETYSKSEVYGKFAPRSKKGIEYERALDNKFDWALFNQHWEPWYGMFDYGDQMNSFFRDNWWRWQNNEPAIDFMYWIQFMRTGDAKYYRAAEAMSRHTMDVDNIHWPADPPYYGDTNESLDWWKWKNKESIASPYLGVGRRHANQHWSAILSAHVWLEGWIASYYLTGYHRGLDIAKLTADSHTRRIWGGHGLTGRRLYLSIWNLVETWDATKDDKYLIELEDRIDRLLKFQNGPEQYDNLIIDRYGYSQIYISHGLYKFYQLTKDEKVKQALIRHARAIRDNPPYNHEYESYLASIHPLIIGHELSGEHSFLDEAFSRSATMKTDILNQSFKELGTQKNIADALKKVSHLPLMGDFETNRRWITNWDPTQGLRVFGWTHIYNIPWLMHYVDNIEKK